MAPFKKSKTVVATTETPVVVPEPTVVVEVVVPETTVVVADDKKSKKTPVRKPSKKSVSAELPSESVSSDTNTSEVVVSPVKRSASKKSAPKATEVVEEVTVPKSKPSKKSAAKTELPKVVVESVETTEDKEPESDTETKKTGGRRTVNKETFEEDCVKFEEMMNAELEMFRACEQPTKNKGMKSMRALQKAFKQLHRDGNKVTKFKKNASTRKVNTTSGFLKPVKISEEMSKFLNWDVTKTYSRTQITKEICNYISSKLLNDPENKRNINCDDKLQTLLNFNDSTATKDDNGVVLPLTYFRLQQYLKHHFIRDDTPVVSELE